MKSREKRPRPDPGSVVPAKDSDVGTVEHDFRGDARWRWVTETDAPAGETDKTFDQLGALSNDALSLEHTSTEAELPKVGYDPYDTCELPRLRKPSDRGAK